MISSVYVITLRIKRNNKENEYEKAITFDFVFIAGAFDVPCTLLLLGGRMPTRV
jgi:hypothetical protein